MSFRWIKRYENTILPPESPWQASFPSTPPAHIILSVIKLDSIPQCPSFKVLISTICNLFGKVCRKRNNHIGLMDLDSD